jgi:hypothetical protein
MELSRVQGLNARASDVYALIWFDNNQVAIVLLAGVTSYTLTMHQDDFVRMVRSNARLQGEQVNTNEERTWFLEPEMRIAPSCRPALDHALSACSAPVGQGALQGFACGGAVSDLQQCLQRTPPSSENCQVAGYAARVFCGAGALGGLICGQFAGIQQYSCR